MIGGSEVEYLERQTSDFFDQAGEHRCRSNAVSVPNEPEVIQVQPVGHGYGLWKRF